MVYRSALSCLLLATLLLTLTAAPKSLRFRMCASDAALTIKDKLELQRFDKQRASMRYEKDLKRTFINVFFHVINIGPSKEQGNVAKLDILNQILVLNTAYFSSRITFVPRKISRTTNARWFYATANSPEELQMKTALRRGGSNVLNIYTNNMYFLDTVDYIGWSAYPASYANAPLLDGVVVDFTTLPLGTLENYNLGQTTTHEVGHWLGLYHTFEGGCDNARGDFVSDTPAELDPTYGCPVGKDSCTGLNFPGLDPITNYMDYSFDSCVTGFTPVQTSRMMSSWNVYRKKEHRSNIDALAELRFLTSDLLAAGASSRDKEASGDSSNTSWEDILKRDVEEVRYCKEKIQTRVKFVTRKYGRCKKTIWSTVTVAALPTATKEVILPTCIRGKKKVVVVTSTVGRVCTKTRIVTVATSVVAV